MRQESVQNTVSRFRQDIQGLRAIAVLAVVAFHVDPELLPGGFLGVDIFFVISGYLITGILIREIERERFSIANFYARRIARLFPALLAMLSVTALAGWLLLPPAALVALGDSLPMAAVFVSNLHFSDRLDYFAPAAELQPLLHTWSLAIEEQFYIVFPFVLVVASRYSNRLRDGLIVIAFTLSLAFAVSLALRGGDGFFHAFARAYELMAGALIAIGAVPALRSRAQAQISMFVGLALILGSFVMVDGNDAIPGWISLVPCVGCGLVIMSGRDHSFAAQAIITNRVSAFFGHISYALYLWHWPILVYAGYLTGGVMGYAVLSACVLLAIVFATLSTRFLEKPILRQEWQPKLALPFGIATIAILSLAGHALTQRDGHPDRFDQRSLELFAAASDYSPYRERCHYPGSGVWTYDDRCRIGGNGEQAIAVWGDSFGVELAAALADAQGEAGHAVLPLTASSCPPALDRSPNTPGACAAFNRAVLAGLSSDASVRTVVLFVHYRAKEYSFWQPAEMLSAAAALRRAGKEVLIIEPVPTYHVPVPDALGIAHRLGRDLAAIGVERVTHVRDVEELRSSLKQGAKRADIRIIDPLPVLCSVDRCHMALADGRVAYFDSEHLSMRAARKLVAETALAHLQPSDP
ncbi:acyltransferase family protein [Erythrobacter litoralis]|uniref:Putative membrane-located cell surface saccharide saccharideacetylase protein n=1 Tax=Erythrobacter litoralis (strain HTCC2594) TaxID=314225 RepID=Q2N5Q8_ERYLH|nr:acyltransferase family protein [Erythrobacter litoralis]ABC64983.1 putative membrane-located cell surface saccharide saccharideacetylase protein [Erythrobacter litoralis HTCC2594]